MTPDLSAAPFHLSPAARDWVASTLARLTPDQKLRQLFNLRLAGSDPAALAQAAAFGPGGITRHLGADADEERGIIAGLNEGALTPLLVSADLEGSRMSLPFGLEVPNPLALAAVDDVAATEAIARLMAREAKSVGINWTFTPVLDINAAFRSRHRGDAGLRVGCGADRAAHAGDPARVPGGRGGGDGEALAGRRL